MSFDFEGLVSAVQAGPVARIVVASSKGSVPREAGTVMLVSRDWQAGTIGGGALEFEAVEGARRALDARRDRLDRVPLGPALGQCCGGAVTLLTEVWDHDRVSAFAGADIVARPCPGEDAAMPLAVKRLLAQSRNGQGGIGAGLIDGWMIEPVMRATRDIWLWGAGHVGRALVSVLSPLPQLSVTWADTGVERFPEEVQDDVRCLVAKNPADLVSLASASAEHYVLTYSHALDLEICHRVLGQGFAHLGLIGSATKRARFRSRLSALGHADAQIDRMQCPIGDPALGKHPHEIALGVATEILRMGTTGAVMIEERA